MEEPVLMGAALPVLIGLPLPLLLGGRARGAVVIASASAPAGAVAAVEAGG